MQRIIVSLRTSVPTRGDEVIRTSIDSCLSSPDEKRSFLPGYAASCGRSRGRAPRTAPPAYRACPVPAPVAGAPSSHRRDHPERTGPCPCHGPCRADGTHGRRPDRRARTGDRVGDPGAHRGRCSRGASHPRGAGPTPLRMAERAASKDENDPLRCSATRRNPPPRTGESRFDGGLLTPSEQPAADRARRDSAGRVPRSFRRRFSRAIFVRRSATPAVRSAGAHGAACRIRCRQSPPRFGVALLAPPESGGPSPNRSLRSAGDLHGGPRVGGCTRRA